MKNKLVDLNNHLFAQLERLSEEDLNDEQLEKEIKRSESMNKIARAIIDNGSLALKVIKYADENGYGKNNQKSLPDFLETESNTEK